MLLKGYLKSGNPRAAEVIFRELQGGGVLGYGENARETGRANVHRVSRVLGQFWGHGKR